MNLAGMRLHWTSDFQGSTWSGQDEHVHCCVFRSGTGWRWVASSKPSPFRWVEVSGYERDQLAAVLKAEETAFARETEAALVR